MASYAQHSDDAFSVRVSQKVYRQCHKIIYQTSMTIHKHESTVDIC